MKKKLVMTLMLTCALSSGFAGNVEVSTLAKRADLIKEAGSDGKKLLETINEKQQKGDIKVDEKNYVVVLKKDGDWIRVAHYKKEQLDKKVEPVLLGVVKDAEDALKSGDGPARIQFNVDGKPLYALVSRCGDFLVFNICADEKEVNNFLGGNKPEEKNPEEKKPEVKPEEKKPEKVEEKPEEKKAESKLGGDDKPKENTPDVKEDENKTKTIEVKKEEKKVEIQLDGDKSKENTPSGKTDEAITPKEDEPQAKKLEEANSTLVKEKAQN